MLRSTTTQRDLVRLSWCNYWILNGYDFQSRQPASSCAYFKDLVAKEASPGLLWELSIVL